MNPEFFQRYNPLLYRWVGQYEELRLWKIAYFLSPSRCVSFFKRIPFLRDSYFISYRILRIFTQLNLGGYAFSDINPCRCFGIVLFVLPTGKGPSSCIIRGVGAEMADEANPCPEGSETVGARQSSGSLWWRIADDTRLACYPL